MIAGGGHVSRAIARQARLLDFDVVVIEDRPAFADPERFDGATVLGGELIPNIAAFHVQRAVVSRRRDARPQARRRLRATRPCGRACPTSALLGSRRKTILIADMLREQGVDEVRIAAIHAPVGLDLGGRTPAEIALSVLAEITQLRYQGTGRPLRER